MCHVLLIGVVYIFHAHLQLQNRNLLALVDIYKRTNLGSCERNVFVTHDNFKFLQNFKVFASTMHYLALECKEITATNHLN